MKQVPRNIAWTLATASLVAGLAGQQASAAGRAVVRAADSSSVVVAPSPGQPTAIDRLTSSRRDLRAIVAEAGLASVDVTEIVDHIDMMSRYLSNVSRINPDMLRGVSIHEFIAGKVPPILEQKGLRTETIEHLTQLAEQMTMQQIDVDVETLSHAAPAVEGGAR